MCVSKVLQFSARCANTAMSALAQAAASLHRMYVCTEAAAAGSKMRHSSVMKVLEGQRAVVAELPKVCGRTSQGHVHACRHDVCGKGTVLKVFINVSLIQAWSLSLPVSRRECRAFFCIGIVQLQP